MKRSKPGIDDSEWIDKHSKPSAVSLLQGKGIRLTHECDAHFSENNGGSVMTLGNVVTISTESPKNAHTIFEWLYSIMQGNNP